MLVEINPAFSALSRPFPFCEASLSGARPSVCSAVGFCVEAAEGREPNPEGVSLTKISAGKFPLISNNFLKESEVT